MSIYREFIEPAKITTTTPTTTTTTRTKISSAATTPKSPSINLLQFNNNYHQVIFNSHHNCSASKCSINKYNHRYDIFFPPEPFNLPQEESKWPIDFHRHVNDKIERNSNEWLCELKYEPELEQLSYMEASTSTYDKNCASAMSIRCSQVSVQDIRLESKVIFDRIELLIKILPIKHDNISKFHSQFNKLKVKLLSHLSTKATHSNNTTIAINDIEQSPLTITFTTPKKSQAVVKTLKPIDKLINQIKNLCNSYEDQLGEYKIDNNHSKLNYHHIIIDNGFLESELRTLKELYEKFLDIIIRAECITIVKSLHYYTYNASNSSSYSKNPFNEKNFHSKAEFEPIKPFETSYSNLPLKWALIALWQLTYNDEYICDILTERWSEETEVTRPIVVNTLPKKVARKLDFSKNDNNEYRETNIDDLIGNLIRNTQLKLVASSQEANVIDSLAYLIINQPNKHQRIDVMKFIQFQKTTTKLIDLDETYQQVASAVFTINQYKVTALKILTHLSVNQEASKRILKLFFGSNVDNKYTDNYDGNCAIKTTSNKIVDSIFKAYLDELDHTYENDNMIECDMEEHCEQPIIREALKLIIQITKQFYSNQNIYHSKDYLNLIDDYSIESFVKYITKIIEFTSDEELLLLSLNSIANISFITLEPMELYDTIPIMIKVIKNRQTDFRLLDQALTILANEAERKSSKLVEKGRLTFLLSGLVSLTKTKLTTKSDLLAMERIQQKTAVAIARVSMEPTCVHYIIEQGGLKILIDLCKYGNMRNYSCAVLIACVKALKLLAKSVNRDYFKCYDGLDLIELNQNQIVDIYGQEV